MEVVLAVVVLGLLVGVIAVVQNGKSGQKDAEERARQERQRVEACGRVVLDFANHLGYIARQALSREELSGLIDQGLSADELASAIADRIEAVPGLTLGYHPFPDSPIPVKLTQEFRDRHVYIVGKSGSGKTNLLRTLIAQDMQAGAGLGVIAPEQEMLTEEILPFVPDHRVDDVIYLNPADTDAPVSFNPLQLDPGEDIDLKVDEMLTIFRRVLEGQGPRMDELLRQSLYTLLDRPGSTLLDIERLLDRTSDAFRQEAIRTVREPELAHFWREVYPSFPKDAHLPITNRLGRFLHPRSIRHLLCPPAGRSLDFGRAMDEGKILLCNCSDGVLGEQNSQLLGQLLVSKFQMAVMSRARQAKASRRPFYLYIDEFQTFTGVAGTSYEKLLSRARKYRLGLVLAHQQTGQLPSSLLKEILGNVSTTICFAVSREDALRFSKEFVTSWNGEILTIPEQDILRLRVGEAVCKMGQNAFRMNTYRAPQQGSSRRAVWIMGRSRENYGTALLAEGTASVMGRTGSKALPTPVADVLADLDPEKLL